MGKEKWSAFLSKALFHPLLFEPLKRPGRKERQGLRSPHYIGQERKTQVEKCLIQGISASDDGAPSLTVHMTIQSDLLTDQTTVQKPLATLGIREPLWRTDGMLKRLSDSGHSPPSDG